MGKIDLDKFLFFKFCFYLFTFYKDFVLCGKNWKSFFQFFMSRVFIDFFFIKIHNYKKLIDRFIMRNSI